MSDDAAIYLGTALIEGPGTLPGVSGQVPTFETDGSFAGWLTGASSVGAANAIQVAGATAGTFADSGATLADGLLSVSKVGLNSSNYVQSGGGTFRIFTGGVQRWFNSNILAELELPLHFTSGGPILQSDGVDTLELLADGGLDVFENDGLTLGAVHAGTVSGNGQTLSLGDGSSTVHVNTTELTLTHPALSIRSKVGGVGYEMAFNVQYDDRLKLAGANVIVPANASIGWAATSTTPLSRVVDTFMNRDSVGVVGIYNTTTATPGTLNVGTIDGSAGTLALQTSGTDALTIDASQDVTLAGKLELETNESVMWGTGKGFVTDNSTSLRLGWNGATRAYISSSEVYLGGSGFPVRVADMLRFGGTTGPQWERIDDSTIGAFEDDGLTAAVVRGGKYYGLTHDTGMWAIGNGLIYLMIDGQNRYAAYHSGFGVRNGYPLGWSSNPGQNAMNVRFDRVSDGILKLTTDGTTLGTLNVGTIDGSAGTLALQTSGVDALTIDGGTATLDAKTLLATSSVGHTTGGRFWFGGVNTTTIDQNRSNSGRLLLYGYNASGSSAAVYLYGHGHATLPSTAVVTGGSTNSGDVQLRSDSQCTVLNHAGTSAGVLRWGLLGPQVQENGAGGLEVVEPDGLTAADLRVGSIGTHGVTPPAQAAHIADVSSGTDAAYETAINAILAVLENLGHVATS